jgi:competence protein ComGC
LSHFENHQFFSIKSRKGLMYAAGESMNQIKTEQGFSLVMTMIAIAIIGVISMALTALFSSLNAQSKHMNSVTGARALISTIQGFIAYPNLCIANLDPSTTSFNATAAASTTGIPLSIQMGSGATGAKVEAGSSLFSYDVDVESLTYRNAALAGADPTIAGNKLYSGELVIKLRKSGIVGSVAGGNEMHERGVGTFVVSVNPSNVITGCYALADARQACNEVGGVYNDSTTPKCKLPYPCAGVPNSMFMGYNTSGIPQCKTMSQIVGSICPSGQYLVSDGSGGATCRAP